VTTRALSLIKPLDRRWVVVPSIPLTTRALSLHKQIISEMFLSKQSIALVITNSKQPKEHTTRSSATTDIARVGGRYTIQGHWCWHPSKARMLFPISE